MALHWRLRCRITVSKAAFAGRVRIFPGADVVPLAEGNTDGCVIASARPTRRGRRPWHVRTLLAREPGDLTAGRDGVPYLVRIGKAMSRSR